ncbi:MAG: TonB-dependent receptor [Bacteroidia bacterium]
MRFLFSLKYKALLFFCIITYAAAAQNYTISGLVKEKSTGEFAIGATVYIKELKKSASVNNYGFYSITIPKGEYTFICMYVGTDIFSKTIKLDKNLVLDVSLASKSVEMEEVVVSTERPDQNVKSSQMGSTTLDIKQIKSLPAFMGEVDILKTIQLLPGVKSAGDGQTGFYVRGGGPDQNLVLLDEAVVYNASHLMGFFSVFNGDAIKNVTLTKGGMPAQYGGRLSSVLDITMKDGNNQKLQVDGGIGIIASRVTVQGPLKKDTGSFIVSARRTYVDAVIQPIFKQFAPEFVGTSYYFYDLNTKFNYRINNKNTLYLSGYFGKDIFQFKDKDANFNVKTDWGNATASLRWNHVYSSKLFSNTSLIYSYYNFGFTAVQDNFEFRIFSGIRDHNAKTDFSWYPGANHNVKFGANYIYHIFIPTNATAKEGETKFDLGDVVKLYSHEAHVYVSDDWDITDKIRLNGGLRFGYFAHVGPFTRFVKDPLLKNTDTVVYSRGKKIQDYNGLEPRFSVRFELTKTFSLKASYVKNYQYVHLASISSVSLPTDVWMPSTDLIKPQIGNQFALGAFKNFRNNMFETSVEVYYKTMQNLIEYKEGAQPQDNVKDNPDNSFTFGKGEAYGGEFFVKKRAGKFTGWVGYTLSWTTRTFPEINGGKTYFAKYDRRHDASVVGTYELNAKWLFSSVFVFNTGNRGTLPSSLYYFENSINVDYGARNSYRFPNYNRLDISVTYTPDQAKRLEKKRKRLEARYARKGKDASQIVLPRKIARNYSDSWTFSVFNAYNRHNPYFIYFASKGSVQNGNFTVQAKQVSLFPALPSVTWNFKF